MHGFLDAQGAIAADERHLFIVVSAVMLFVIGPVLLLVPVFAWHYRLANTKSAFRPKWEFSWPLEVLIWIPPTLIVVGLAILLWHRVRQLDPYAALASRFAPIEVQAVGFDWKWLFIYPDLHVATLNELAIPAGRPVHITLTSGTVMQSMFIPQLAGQIYAMAGMSTQLNLIADKTGTFSGENTQYNGAGFPKDRFTVLSLSLTDYAGWIARVRSNGQTLDTPHVAKLFDKTAEPTPIFYSPVPAGLFRTLQKRALAGTGTARVDEGVNR